MKCTKAADTLYESAFGEVLPFPARLQLALHILFCGRCAASAARYDLAALSFHTEFLPASPDFSDTIMARIYEEEEEAPLCAMPGGISTRRWVIAGCITFLSLATAFFGQDFISVASRAGSSFLIPLGITVGIVITAYGALFIGSHLKELSNRFLSSDSHSGTARFR